MTCLWNPVNVCGARGGHNFASVSLDIDFTGKYVISFLCLPKKLHCPFNSAFTISCEESHWQLLVLYNRQYAKFSLLIIKWLIYNHILDVKVYQISITINKFNIMYCTYKKYFFKIRNECSWVLCCANFNQKP